MGKPMQVGWLKILHMEFTLPIGQQLVPILLIYMTCLHEYAVLCQHKL